MRHVLRSLNLRMSERMTTTHISLHFRSHLLCTLTCIAPGRTRLDTVVLMNNKLPCLVQIALCKAGRDIEWNYEVVVAIPVFLERIHKVTNRDNICFIISSEKNSGYERGRFSNHKSRMCS